jgi:hypothetical protein
MKVAWARPEVVQRIDEVQKAEQHHDGRRGECKILHARLL